MPHPELDPTIRVRLIDGLVRLPDALAAALNQRHPHGHENCELPMMQLTERLSRQPAWLLVSRILCKQAQDMLARLAGWHFATGRAWRWRTSKSPTASGRGTRSNGSAGIEVDRGKTGGVTYIVRFSADDFQAVAIPSPSQPKRHAASLRPAP